RGLGGGPFYRSSGHAGVRLRAGGRGCDHRLSSIHSAAVTASYRTRVRSINRLRPASSTRALRRPMPFLIHVNFQLPPACHHSNMDRLGAALVATATTARSETSVGSFLDRGQPNEAMSFTTMMVHLDVERDCEQRVQLALALADRFQAALIGVAGLALRPAFAAGGVVVYHEPTEHESRTVSARLDEMGGRFRVQGQHLKQVE